YVNLLDTNVLSISGNHSAVLDSNDFLSFTNWMVDGKLERIQVNLSSSWRNMRLRSTTPHSSFARVAGLARPLILDRPR
ncbi:hypothetical protein PENTCL1PPCAC_20283, partial [Pristionchus entomophagus]